MFALVFNILLSIPNFTQSLCNGWKIMYRRKHEQVFFKNSRKRDHPYISARWFPSAMNDLCYRFCEAKRPFPASIVFQLRVIDK